MDRCVRWQRVVDTSGGHLASLQVATSRSVHREGHLVVSTCRLSARLACRTGPVHPLQCSVHTLESLLCPPPCRPMAHIPYQP